jgi:hypothetical protein
MKWRERSNCLGRSVDLGLLPRIPKGLQVLVSRMGDLIKWSFATMEEREWKQQSAPEVEDDYLYCSQKTSRCGSLTPESLACQSLWPQSAHFWSLEAGSKKTPDLFQRRAPLGRKTKLSRSDWPESPAQDQSFWCFTTGVSGLEGQSLHQKIHNNRFSEWLSNLFRRMASGYKYSFVPKWFHPNFPPSKPSW